GLSLSKSRKIRGPYLTRNLRLDHAESVTQHTLSNPHSRWLSHRRSRTFHAVDKVGSVGASPKEEASILECWPCRKSIRIHYLVQVSLTIFRLVTRRSRYS